MKIQFLGTGASEGWPGIFCQCQYCKEARRLGGKNLRTRSSVLINDNFKVDFPPDTYMHVLNNKIDLSAVDHMLITHSHEDHYYLNDIMNRRPVFSTETTKPLLNIYGNDCIVDMGNRAKSLAGAGDDRILFHELQAFKEYDIGPAKVIPLLARHNPKEKCYVYSIEIEEQKLFFGHDSGFYPPETWDYIKDSYFHGVILECTNGKIETGEGSGHMGIDDVIEVKDKMESMGIIDKASRVFVTHFSHNGGLLHQELEERLNPYGVSVAYDGKMVII